MNIFDWIFGVSTSEQPAAETQVKPAVPDAGESAFSDNTLSDDDVIEYVVANPDTGQSIEVDGNGNITQKGYDDLVAVLETKTATGEWTPIYKKGGQIGKSLKEADVARIGKPVGDRFKTDYAKRTGKNPYKHPTKEEVTKAKEHGQYGTGKGKKIYSENRKNRSDQAPITKHLEKGGDVKKGKGNEMMKNIQKIAKQIKAENPGKKWTDCIKDAAAQLKKK